MAGQGNDFFLQFGSDAEPFSRQLASDLDPGIKKINALRTALEQYETQAQSLKGGSSPLGLTFEGLDAAASRIEKASSDFSRQFGRQMQDLTSRITGLAEILNTAARNTGRSAPGGRVPPPSVGGKPLAQQTAAERAAIQAEARRRDAALNQATARTAPNATRVTPAEQAAARDAKVASDKSAQSSKALADANSATAKNAEGLSGVLDSLNDRLKTLIETAKQMPGTSTGGRPAGDPRASNAEASLTITNTTGNPVPVIVVGGEAQAAGGHASHQPHHTPTATTATATAKAREEVQAAAELTNAPNSRRNPSRVMGTDTVAPGQYFLLPGDDEKQPRRAYGIRPGETAGDYTRRVDSVREREPAYRRLSDASRDDLRLASERYGPFPDAKSRVEPGTFGKSAQGQETVNARSLPRDVQALLNRRDIFHAEASDQGKSFILDELRRDPHMTQDGLAPESKAALARLDAQILALQNHSQAARLFDSKGTPEFDALREGATRRRYLSDTGVAAFEERGQRQYINSRATEINDAHDQAYNSDAFMQQLKQSAKAREAAGTAGKENRLNSLASRQNAENFAARLGRLQNHGGFFTDPEDLDESGAPRRFTLDQLNRSYSAMTSPLRGDLNEQVRRNTRNAQNNRARGNPEKAAEYEAKARHATELRSQISVPVDTAKDTEYERTMDAYKAAKDQHEAVISDAQSQIADMERQAMEHAPAGRTPKQARASVRRSKRYTSTQSALSAAQADLAGLRRPPRPEVDVTSEFDKLRAAAQGYLQYRVGQNTDISIDTLAERPDAAAGESDATTPGNAGKSSRRGRRGGATQGEGQAVAAVREATTEVEAVKNQIHDLNQKLAQVKARRAKTHDGSNNQQKLDAQITKLNEQKEQLKQERTRLNRAAVSKSGRTSGGSKSEQARDPQELLRQGLILESEVPLVEELNQRRAVRAAGGGKPPTPPRPPARPAAGGEDEPEETNGRPKRNRPLSNLAGGRGSSGDLDVNEARRNQFNALDESTQNAIQAERQRLAGPGLSREDQLASINRAALAFRTDHQYGNNKNLWGGGNANSISSERVRALTGMLGLDTEDSATRRSVQLGIQRGASELRASQSGRVERPGAGAAPSPAEGATESAGASERAARMEDVLAMSSSRVKEALLAEIIAMENLDRVKANSAATTSERARAEMQLSTATRASAAAQEQAAAEENRGAYSRLTGRTTGSTFGKDLMRHSTSALENTIGYSLVFTGFEKLRELVQTGIESQAVFVRLQQSLEANGIAAGNLRSQLSQISATTATPLEAVTEAAAELSGTLKTSGDIAFGTKIASQLANISQGALTAKEAAVGLRDVIAAYGDQWANSGMTVQQGLQQTGDQIAHLSQMTGVSVKDITEGTTQIAQEAHEFGLTQRQASTLAAYVTKGTGESGEQAASQTSRMLATLYNGKTQTVLENTRLYGKDGKPLVGAGGNPQTLATASEFSQGKIGEVLQNIAAHWQELSPRARQEISAQMGTGIQARAFTAYVAGGANAASEMGSGSDSGSLNKQNESYLQTVAGMIKQLDEDFQNMGSTLQRIGAFDAIGILAKSLDELLKTFNQVFGGIAKVMESNPLTSGLMKWSVVILEAAAAWKLFGGAATKALVSMGPLRGMAPSNAGAIQAAQSTPGAIVPRPTYDRVSFRQAAGAIGSSARGGLGNVWAAGYRPGDTALGRYYAQPGDNSGSLMGPLGMSPEGLRRLRNIPSTIRSLPSNVWSGLQGQYMTARYGAVVNPEGGLPIRAAQVRSALREQRSVMGRATAAATAEGAAATPVPLTSASAKAVETNLRGLGLSAQSAAILIRTSAEEQAVAASTATLRLRMFGAGLATSLAGLAAQLGLFAAIGFAISQMGSAKQDSKNRNDAADRILSGGTDVKDISTVSKPQNFRDWYLGDTSSTVGQVGNALKHTGQGAVDGFASVLGLHPFGGSGKNFGQPSDQSNAAFMALSNREFGGFAKGSEGAKNAAGNQTIKDALPGMKSVDDVTQWQKDQLAYIDDHAADIEKAGGNSKEAQAQIAANINQLKANLTAAGEKRIAAIEGLAAIDQLNADQAAAIGTSAGQISSLSPETLSTQSTAVATMLANTGLPTQSRAYLDLVSAADTGKTNQFGINSKGQLGFYKADGTFVDQTATKGKNVGPSEGTNLPQLGNGPSQNNGNRRLAALQDAYQQQINDAQAHLDDPAQLNDQDRAKWLQNLTTGLTGYQQATQQKAQAPITQAQGAAGLLASLGGTPAMAKSLGLGGGGDAAAVAQLNQANSAISAYNNTLQKTDPQYWTNLQQIQQNKAQIAQLQASPQLTALAIQAASTTDAVQQAYVKYQQAVLQLAVDQKGGASSVTIGQDQAGIAAAQVAERQAQEAVSAAQAAAGMAGVRNDVNKAQAQLNEALRLEAVYAGGGSLSDQASEANARAQETQARLAIRDAIEAQTQAAYDATSSLDKLHGDDVGAATVTLAKAQQAYSYAVSQYGASSQQALSALSQIYSTRAELITAQLAQVNSFLDLDIALLNARGQSGDAEKASQDSVAKARNAINSYLSAGGKKGTTQYNNLMGQLASAQRTAFDTQLQAQLDTLDFQQQTYQITSGQEVQSLQQILKNKQLTLKEQRDITLKIKNLQESIRQQLTEGGLNIPSDIKLPTAYDVRRSMGAGFGGSASSVNTVNNNQQVTVNNNVPNQQVAATIASQVIQLINQQTSMGLRSNSSTPRTVATK